ncbi:MAG: endonuclease/exonuclease/phosphatase family protein [Flavobacteriaceae bacterium]|nr:endonuclease/exonuclease/phosphatase family protein [Flavobacteriaceae bacterium]
MVHKFVYFFNVVAALLLLISYILPYIPPKSFPMISVLSLSVPVLILINLLFVFYGLFFMKRMWMLSFFVLLLGFQNFKALYKFSHKENALPAKHIRVMSYNVRLFNFYKWIADDSIPSKMGQLIKKADPSLIALQDYHPSGKPIFDGYTHRFEKLKGQKSKSGLAIFSMHPIVAQGSLDFPDTSNNGIFVDVLVQKDTIRVYNVHFQSLKISPEMNDLGEQNYELLGNRIAKAFVKQQAQLDVFLAHYEKSPYKTIVMGDFNNTAFSYLYRKMIRAGLQDSFVEAGYSFGKTYDFKLFPLRIDFILSDENFRTLQFKTYEQKNSDHFPIAGTLGWE